MNKHLIFASLLFVCCTSQTILCMNEEKNAQSEWAKNNQEKLDILNKTAEEILTNPKKRIENTAKMIELVSTRMNEIIELQKIKQQNSCQENK